VTESSLEKLLGFHRPNGSALATKRHDHLPLISVDQLKISRRVLLKKTKGNF